MAWLCTSNPKQASQVTASQSGNDDQSHAQKESSSSFFVSARRISIPHPKHTPIMTTVEKIKEIEAEMARTQKNKVRPIPHPLFFSTDHLSILTRQSALQSALQSELFFLFDSST